jgi:hypothetical protein
VCRMVSISYQMYELHTTENQPLRISWIVQLTGTCVTGSVGSLAGKGLKLLEYCKNLPNYFKLIQISKCIGVLRLSDILQNKCKKLYLSRALHFSMRWKILPYAWLA